MGICGSECDLSVRTGRRWRTQSLLSPLGHHTSIPAAGGGWKTLSSLPRKPGLPGFADLNPAPASWGARGLFPSETSCPGRPGTALAALRGPHRRQAPPSLHVQSRGPPSPPHSLRLQAQLSTARLRCGRQGPAGRSPDRGKGPGPPGRAGPCLALRTRPQAVPPTSEGQKPDLEESPSALGADPPPTGAGPHAEPRSRVRAARPAPPLAGPPAAAPGSGSASRPPRPRTGRRRRTARARRAAGRAAPWLRGAQEAGPPHNRPSPASSGATTSGDCGAAGLLAPRAAGTASSRTAPSGGPGGRCGRSWAASARSGRRARARRARGRRSGSGARGSAAPPAAPR